MSDVLHVALDRRLHQRVNPVEQFVRAGERARVRGSQVEEIAGEAVDDGLAVRGAGHRFRHSALDLHVAEPGVSEARAPSLQAGSRQRVGEVRRPARGVLAHQAGIVEQFAGRHTHRTARRTAHRDLRPSREVLAEVVDENAGLGLGHF